MRRFQIPTLEEARRKDEESIKRKDRSPPPKLSSSLSTQSSSSSATSKPTVAAMAATTTTTTTATKVKNPYAASKKTAVKNPYIQQQKSSSTMMTKKTTPATIKTNNSTRKSINNNNKSTPISSSSSSQRPKRSPLSLLKKSTGEEMNATSFSQAFGSIPPDDEDEHELYDEMQTSTVAESTVTTSNVSPTKIIETNANTAANPARDNHINLEHSHVLHISTRQRGNPLLPHIRNVPYTFSTMIPDYILSTSKCILFLSCKYHALHPKYIFRRIAELKTDFTVRILLVLVDLEDNVDILATLNHVAVRNDLSLVLCWSNEEAARYIETYKSYESKDASSIQGKRGNSSGMDYIDQVANVFTAVRSVNKTDVHTLLEQFGSVRDVVCSNVEEMSLCPGLGEKKVRRLWEAFRKPFSSLASKKRKRDKMLMLQQQQKEEEQDDVSVSDDNDDDEDESDDHEEEKDNDKVVRKKRRKSITEEQQDEKANEKTKI